MKSFVKTSRTRFSDNRATSKREAVALDDTRGVEGDLLDVDLSVGEPGGESRLEFLRAEGSRCTKPESTWVDRTIPGAVRCNFGAWLACFSFCDDFLELVDGVAELFCGHFCSCDAFLGVCAVTFSSFMLCVEVDGNSGDLLEELLPGGIDNGLGGGFKLTGSMFDLCGESFFELLS